MDPGALGAWITGLEKKLFVDNEKAARELGLLNVVNRVGIADMKAKLSACDRRLLLFEVKTNG